MSRRRILAATGGGGWVNPYVTDGLVAMWDGEWNAGGGVHDPNATVWKDLVGNRDLSFVNVSYSWGDNFWSKNGYPGYARCDGFPFANAHTQEMVVITGEGSYWGRLIAEQRGLCIYINRSPAINGFGLDQTIGKIWDTYNVQSIKLTYDGSKIRVYNGTELKFEGNGRDVTSTSDITFGNRASDEGRGSEPSFYCIRLYDKCLTDSEIAANYAVDKARFNLP